jgi:RecB family exonuclease
VQAALRRTLVDPASPLPDRLAAAQVLAHSPVDHWDATTFAGVSQPGPDHGVVNPPFRLSPSQAQAYTDCPRRYALEHRVRVLDRSSPSAAFGTLVHAGLERADRIAMERGAPRPTLDDAMAALESVWAEEAEFGSPSLNSTWLEKAQGLIERLFAEWPSDSQRTIDVERPLQLVLDEIEWIGRADRIEQTTDGTLRVVDYKTSANPMPVKEAEAAIQLGFYVLAAASDPEVTARGEVASAEFWYPRTKYKSFRRSFDPARLDDVTSQLREIGRGIRDERWPARVGTWCQWCTVRSVCPLWPEGREAFLP